MPDSPAMKALRRQARRFAAAQAARDTAMTELEEAIRAADREGKHNRTEIADAAGVSRPTVYAALKAKD